MDGEFVRRAIGLVCLGLLVVYVVLPLVGALIWEVGSRFDEPYVYWPVLGTVFVGLCAGAWWGLS